MQNNDIEILDFDNEENDTKKKKKTKYKMIRKGEKAFLII